MADKVESNLEFGASNAFEIEKAACGIRFSEASLDEETHFDFSNAVKLKSEACGHYLDEKKACE